MFVDIWNYSVAEFSKYSFRVLFPILQDNIANVQENATIRSWNAFIKHQEPQKKKLQPYFEP